jgi:hypothetical protein
MGSSSWPHTYYAQTDYMAHQQKTRTALVHKELSEFVFDVKRVIGRRRDKDDNYDGDDNDDVPLFCCFFTDFERVYRP